MKKFETNVYAIYHNDVVVYIGKGTGKRWLSKKNDWFNLFDNDLEFRREIVKTFRDENKNVSDKLSETFESKLIRKYKPIFNLNEGLTPQKYIDGDYDLSLGDMVDSLIENTSGNGTVEPMEIAMKMVREHINTSERDILVIGNKGYAGINLINEVNEKNPNANITFITPGDPDYVYVKLSDKVKSKGIKIMKSDVSDYVTQSTDKFDYIIGNPPYQKMVSDTKSESIWAEITSKLFSKVREGGTMTMIHPSGWRMLKGRSKQSLKDVNFIYTNHKIEHMEFNDYQKGKETFGVGTDYDIISVRKETVSGSNIVEIETKTDGKIKFDIKGKLVIPTDNITLFDKLTNGSEKVDILYSSSSYETRKDYISKVETKEYKFPVVYNNGKGKGLNLIWSEVNDRGHFGVSKLIIPRASYNVVEDYDGKYGVAQFAISVVGDKKYLKNVKKAMDTDKFRELSTYFIGDQNKTSLMDTNGTFEKFIYEFNKDFYKEFI